LLVVVVRHDSIRDLTEPFETIDDDMARQVRGRLVFAWLTLLKVMRHTERGESVASHDHVTVGGIAAMDV